MPPTARKSEDPEYQIEIDNGEGFGMQLRPAEAELVFNALAPLLGKMSVHSVPELTAALNELAHLRKFRDDLQRENARVAMKNQKLEERLQLVVKLLDENTPKSLEYAALLAKSELV